MNQYQIITIFNDAVQYAAMADSFKAAGFGPGRARFTPCDNSTANGFDPYQVIGQIAGSTDPEPYVIVCHQDVRLDQRDGIAELDAILDLVGAADPDWAILGNAGTNFRRQARYWIDQPGSRSRSAPVPEACISLDENFLVFHRQRSPRTTPGLRGFHLYGTDAVLNAAMAGRRSYVVPFLLTHLSLGSPDSPGFRDACQQFQAAWNPRLTLGIVNTTCASFVLSRWRPVRYAVQRVWQLRHGLARCRITLAGGAWNLIGLGKASSLRLAKTIG